MSSFNVRGENAQINTFTNVMGLGPAEIVAVNPTKQELTEIIGRELPESLFDYSIKENAFNDNKERPIRFWLFNKEFDIYVPMTFSIQNKPYEAGEWKGFINSVGSYTIERSADALKENPRMSWFTNHKFRQAFIGENSLYTFMQKALRYSNRKEDAAWLEDMVNNKCDIETLYKGDYSGLREFVDHCRENNFKISVLYTVRKRIMDDGTVKYYQEVSTDPKTFFWSDGGVTKRSIDSLDKYIRDQQNRRNRDITKSFYCVNFGAFDEKNAMNLDSDSAPDDVYSEAEDTTSDLPF